MSLLAQLNVDADRLANHYQRDYGHHQPIVPLTEWVGVHLLLPQGTITSNHEAALRNQATGPPLLKTMKIKYGWTNRSVSYINWRAHGSSLRKQMPKRTHLIKLVHGLLPTNTSIHRHDPIRRMCPACMKTSETWHHMPRCPHEARGEWRRKTLSAIDDVCAKSRTKPELRHLLFDSINGWLHHDNPAPFHVDMSSYPSGVYRLIAQQNEIGWDHLFLGRFSREWGRLQDEYYARQVNQDKNKRRTGHRWQMAIIGKLWDQGFLVWEVRNADKHGVDSTAKARTERLEVDRSLRVLYALRNHMEPSVRDILCDDITQHVGKSTKYNQNWLATHGPTIRSSVKSATQKALRNMRSIREWFRPIPGS